jgi:hypothetical protein
MRDAPTYLDVSGSVSASIDPPPKATSPEVMKQYKHFDCLAVSDVFKSPWYSSE